MLRLLLLCSQNGARSQIAEGFILARRVPYLTVVSAGTSPAAQINPLAVRVMGEVGIDISNHVPKSLSAFAGQAFDLVIALCAEAAANDTPLPGRPDHINWNLSDPAGIVGTEDEVIAHYRALRDQVRRLVDDFFDRGYYAAFIQARRNAELVSDSIGEGILAHDLDRRIVFFNRAAERITGYPRDEVVGRRCDEAFAGSFCGGKCRFQGDVPLIEEDRQAELAVAARDGTPLTLHATYRRLAGQDGKTTGALVLFRDITHERRLARRVGAIQSFSGIVGQDASMLEVFDLIRDLADSNVPVLVHGESGTGKELVAAAIHNEGVRGTHPFVPVNCGALPETLLEAELFGHVRGAFTGAVRDKKGRFELADGGTIFLDEIGDISPAMQVKLLRVLQEGCFERIGGESTIKVDVRVVSATHRDLTREIAEGRFREDLFYRLSVVPVWLPPLRERRADIPLLVEHLMARIMEQTGHNGVTVSREALSVLMSHDWPGNVRELQNWLQFAMVKCKGNEILPEHLPPPRAHAAAPPSPLQALARRPVIDEATVAAALAATSGNKVAAARRLGISRATLYRFLAAAGGGTQP